MKNYSLNVLKQVPVDYYQHQSFLQKIWHRGKLRAVLGLMSSEPKNILDAGCASGWFLNQIAANYPRAKCTGIDLYPEAVEYGNKLYPNLKLVQGDAQKLPFKDSSFDLVLCTEVVEHVENLTALIAEIKRVLTKDGIVIIEVDSGSWLFNLVWKIWIRLKGGVWHDAHMKHFSVQQLERGIQSTGLKIQIKKYFNLGMAVAYGLTAI